MEIERPPHPLSAWLEREGSKPYQFAEQALIGRGTIYRLINGDGEPKISTLTAIEVATTGAVTTAQMYDWYTRYKEV